jgi:hypothetical protein
MRQKAGINRGTKDLIRKAGKNLKGIGEILSL